MTTESFCRHSHIRTEENNICHWGFDAVNWRNYIRVHDLLDSEIEIQHKFTNFIRIESQGRDTTLEDDLEAVATKKGNPMFNLTIPALASLLQAQQPTSGPSTSGVPSASSNAQNNLLTLLQLQALNANSSSSNNSNANPTSVVNQSLLTQLQSQVGQQNVPANSSLPQSLGQNFGLLSLQQQQQQLNVIRNILQNSTNSDESGIPRKRAHTLADPSSCKPVINEAVHTENPPNTNDFGSLPSGWFYSKLLRY